MGVSKVFALTKAGRRGRGGLWQLLVLGGGIGGIFSLRPGEADALWLFERGSTGDPEGV